MIHHLVTHKLFATDCWGPQINELHVGLKFIAQPLCLLWPLKWAAHAPVELDMGLNWAAVMGSVEGVERQLSAIANVLILY